MKAKLISAFGEEKTIRDWTIDKRCVISYDILRSRLKNANFTTESAITTPELKSKLGGDIEIGYEIHRFTVREKYMKAHYGQNATYVKVDCKCGTKGIELPLRRILDGNTRSCGCLQSEIQSERAIERNTIHGQASRGGFSELYKKWSRMKHMSEIAVCEEWKEFVNFEKWSNENGYEDGYHIYLLDEDGKYEPKNCLWHSMNYSEERLHSTWTDMLDRCRNQNNKEYHCYGGRGIKVCEEWKNRYFIFKEWAWSNGYNDTLTIERKDNDKGYNPENCTWIPLSDQYKNRNKPYYHLPDKLDHRKNKRGA